MPYRVIEVLEESDLEVPKPLTCEQRAQRAVEGVFPCASGNDSLFTIKAPA